MIIIGFVIAVIAALVTFLKKKRPIVECALIAAAIVVVSCGIQAGSKVGMLLGLAAVISFAVCYGLEKAYDAGIKPRTNETFEKKEKWFVRWATFVLTVVPFGFMAIGASVMGAIVSGLILFFLGAILFKLPEKNPLIRAVVFYSIPFCVDWVATIIVARSKVLTWEGIKNSFYLALIGPAVVLLCWLAKSLLDQYAENKDIKVRGKVPEESEPAREPESEEEIESEGKVEPEGEESEGKVEPEGEPEPVVEPERRRVWFDDDADDDEFDDELDEYYKWLGEQRSSRKRKVNWWTVAFVATLVVAAAVVCFVILR